MRLQQNPKMGGRTIISALLLLHLFLLVTQMMPVQGLLRLVDGGPMSGRLEIFLNGAWGTICDDDFGAEDARVACRELGLDTVNVGYYPRARYGQGSGDILMDNVECTGTELTLESCVHTTLHDCSHSEDVSISCGSDLEDIRLVGGGSYDGRLEVLYDGAWGTVCNDNFDSNAAMVACRQLGLPTSSVDYSTSTIPGTGNIWLDEVNCVGTEWNLDACIHNSYGSHDCSHAEDVSISCDTAYVGGGSSSSFSGVGSWIGGAIFFIVLCFVAGIYRRRRVNAMRHQQRMTVIQQPTTTTVHVTTNPTAAGNTPMPTYHHAPAPQPGGPRPYPTQTFTPAYPPAGAGGAPPANPYPVQAYPLPAKDPTQPPVGTTPYPPQGSAPYPPPAATAPYPAPAATASYPPPAEAGGAPYPPPAATGAAPYPPPTGTGAAPYPPPSAPYLQQQPGDAPPMYLPQTGNAPEADLPPPPSYDDIVKH